MPVYIYECEDCEEQFKVSHGMTENHKQCDLCDAENIRRIPTMFTNLSKKIVRNNKTGDVTKEFIESSKEELRNEKRELDGKR